MLDSLWLIIPMSILLGFLSGLGTGGGSLLILWLTLVLELPQQDARIVNLMFFVPAATVACLFRKTQGTLHLKKAIPATIAGCLCALLFSFVGQTINGMYLKKLFGVLLLLTGLKELFYRERKAK
jgi:uncharacterized membrane protein YfcA